MNENLNRAVRAFNRAMEVFNHNMVLARQVSHAIDYGEVTGRYFDLAQERKENRIAEVVAEKFNITVEELNDHRHRYDWEEVYHIMQPRTENRI